MDTLLDGIALLLTDGRAAAAPTLLRATSAFSRDDVPVDECLRWGLHATAAGNALWDDDGVRAVCTRQIQIARDAGALGQVPPIVLALGNAAARGGDFAATASHMTEGSAISEATGTRLPPYTEMLALAMRGREAEAVSLIKRTIEQAEDVRQGIAATTAYWAAAILYNGLGRYKDARGGGGHLRAARHVCRDVVAAGAGRVGRTYQSGRRRARCGRATGGDDATRWHRLGPRRRGTVAGRW